MSGRRSPQAASGSKDLVRGVGLSVAALLLAGCAGSTGPAPAVSPPTPIPSPVDLGLSFTVDPSSVAPGGSVTYTLASRRGPAVPVVVHLAPAAELVAPEGSGWICQAASRSGDAPQPLDHLDVRCTPVGSGLSAPPLRLVVKVPATTGRLRTCVTSEKGLATPQCVEVSVQR